MGVTTETAQEFVEGYARRSKMTVEELYKWGKVVVNCPPERCDYERCTGWALVSRQAFDEDHDLYGWTIALPGRKDQA